MGIRHAVVLASLVVGIGTTVTGTALAEAPGSPCDQRGAQERVQGQTGQHDTQHYCVRGYDRVYTFTQSEEERWHPETAYDTPSAHDDHRPYGDGRSPEGGTEEDVCLHKGLGKSLIGTDGNRETWRCTDSSGNFTNDYFQHYR